MAQYVFSMRKVRKAHGDKVVLDDVTLAFLPGAKIGVVGPNGAGQEGQRDVVENDLVAVGLADLAHGEDVLSHTSSLRLRAQPDALAPGAGSGRPAPAPGAGGGRQGGIPLRPRTPTQAPAVRR